MFIVVQFIIGKNWNSSKCPLIEKYIHQIQYNSEIAQVRTRVISTGYASIMLLHRELGTTTLYRRTKTQELMLNNLAINSLWPHGLYRPWNSPGQDTKAGSCPFLQGIFPNPEIEPRSPALQADSSSAELPGKPWQSTEPDNMNSNPSSDLRVTLGELVTSMILGFIIYEMWMILIYPLCRVLIRIKWDNACI